MSKKHSIGRDQRNFNAELHPAWSGLVEVGIVQGRTRSVSVRPA
jgi:hypothetical protein